jgi:hypothetical protein
MVRVIRRVVMDSRANVLPINVLLMMAGFWLMLTAVTFQYHIGNPRFGYHIGSPPQMNEFFVGALIFVISLLCAVNPSASFWLSWVNVALGIWLILSPFLLGYANLQLARWNEIVLGVIVVGLGVWSVLASRGQPSARR